ncbi:hypothetical protein I3A86_24025, partial [Salmonella enterica]|nr:hypothetical protein [Salmonella enterica]
AYYDTLDAAFDNKGDPIVKPELAEELQQKLRLGGFQPNPARSELVGVLGLWREGEPAHEPGDRALLSPYSVSPKKALLASAHARASGDVLTIDLSNSVPEIDKDGTKIDLGRMLITAHSPDPAVVADTVIGSISYDQYRQEAYNLHAGIVTLHAPGVEKLVENMTLSLTCPDRKQQGPAELMEQPLRAIAEVPNIYLDQGQVENLSIRVLERGRPVGAGVKIDVVMTDNSYQTQTSPPRAQAIT